MAVEQYEINRDGGKSIQIVIYDWTKDYFAADWAVAPGAPSRIRNLKSSSEERELRRDRVARRRSRLDRVLPLQGLS